MTREQRKPTKVKGWIDPDLAKTWEKFLKKYPYLFWVRSMNVRNDDEWYALIKGREPDISHPPKIPESPEEYAAIAAARRDIYFQLARAFAAPTKELVDEVIKGYFTESIKKSAVILFNDQRINEGIKLISAFADKFRNMQTDKLWDNLDREYQTVFYDGFFPWISGYESIYRSEKQVMGDTTMDVKNCYMEGGYGISLAHGNNPPDDLKLEIEFMYRLCELEIDAWKNNSKEKAVANLGMQKRYLHEHMMEWIPYLCDDLVCPEFKEGLGQKFHFDEEIREKYKKDTVEADFYRGLGYITKSLLEHDYNQIDAMIGAAEKIEAITRSMREIKPKKASKEMFGLISAEKITEKDVAYIPEHPDFT